MESIRLETHIVKVEDYSILTLSGEIDVFSAPQFKQAVNSIVEGIENHLIVDMNNVKYMDSSGFGILLSALKKLRPVGGTVNLIGCAAPIERVLKITKLDTIFNMYTSVGDAINAITSKN